MRSESLSENKVSLTVFLSLLPLLYYIDYSQILYKYVIGFPEPYFPQPFTDGGYLRLIDNIIKYADYPIWMSLIIYPSLYIIYGVMLLKYSEKLEKSIDESFKKFLPLILPIFFSFLIFVNAYLAENSDSQFITKLSWCWGIGIVLTLYKMFKLNPKKDAV